MTADEAIQSLRWQIRNVKQNLKGDSKYIEGYITALSAVEGMIAEVRPEAITVLDYLKIKGGSND